MVWALIVLLGYALAAPFLFLNRGVSMPPGWYWCDLFTPNLALAEGQPVLFVLAPSLSSVLVPRHAELETDGPVYLLKRVVSFEGDEVEVAGDHPRSIDSRFFGPIPRVSIHYTCTALWTWR